MVIHAGYEERYWYPDDGGQVWVAGYQLLDSGSGRYLARDAPELTSRGLHVTGVAGAGRHHAEAIASSKAVAPGSPLELRRDPENEHDPNAIAVCTPEGQLGFVPRDLAALLAPSLDAGEQWTALVLREQRASPRDPRTGVTILVAPEPIELDVR